MNNLRVLARNLRWSGMSSGHATSVPSRGTHQRRDRIGPMGAVMAAIASLGLASTATAAPLVQAYGFSAGGESNFGVFGCSTFGPTAEVRAAIPGAASVSPPIGAGCGVGGDLHAITAGSGVVSAGSSLAVGFGASPDLRAYVGSSNARARSGQLGAEAHGSYSGSSDSGTVIGSEAFGLYRDKYTIAGATVGQPGTFRPKFTVDGSLALTGRGFDQMIMTHQKDSGPQFAALKLQLSTGSLPFIVDGSGVVPSLPGLTVSLLPFGGISIGGSTDISFDVPMIFGTGFDLTMVLWTSALPSSSVGLLTGSSADSAFFTTATMTGITVLDVFGNPLSDFSVVTQSGTFYDRFGVHFAPTASVPEPGTLAIFALAALAMFGCARRRPRHGMLAE